MKGYNSLMPVKAPAIQTRKDMLRAFRFPKASLRDFAFLLLGAALLALLLKALSRRKGKPSPPPVGEIDASQRREDFRVPAQFSAEYLPEGAPLWIPGTICDLSASGVTLLIHHLPIPTGRLGLRFRYEEESFEDLTLQVIRLDAAHWTRRHYLHCRFLDLPPAAEHRLRHVISKRECELLKQRPSPA